MKLFSYLLRSHWVHRLFVKINKIGFLYRVKYSALGRDVSVIWIMLLKRFKRHFLADCGRWFKIVVLFFVVLCFYTWWCHLWCPLFLLTRVGFFICRVALFHLRVSESGYLLFAAGRSRDLVVLLLIVQLSEAVSCRCFFFRVLLLVGFVDFLRVWFSPAFFPRLLLMWLFCFFAWAVVCCAVCGFRVFFTA